MNTTIWKCQFCISYRWNKIRVHWQTDGQTQTEIKAQQTRKQETSNIALSTVKILIIYHYLWEHISDIHTYLTKTLTVAQMVNALYNTLHTFNVNPNKEKSQSDTNEILA